MRVLSPLSEASTLALSRNESANADPKNGAETTTSVKTPVSVPSSTVPTVVLDTDVVSDNMAARLCVSFLGHVLFLKNQVPFPIIQLAKMPTTDSTARSIKKRQELLNSFDTLASHLYTTFIALSTALALRGSPDNAKAETGVPRRYQKHGAARTFFAVALGPTVGTAKSRVIVGIDGLETKVWGLQEDNTTDNATWAGDTSDDDNSPLEDTSDEDEQDEQTDGEEDESSDEEEIFEYDDVSPPLSRSPSPSASSDSDTSPQDVHSTSPSSRTEDPETVRAAERLLSRTLASACAEGDDHGLASEMAPTQVHILLRAPRRFDHPCWVPRQNLCSSLDSYLADFLTVSGEAPISCHSTVRQRTKSGKVQGVWVKSRQGSTQIECSEEDLAEEDELIWWSWDGKLVGFADW